ncbi:MAG: methylenetetrahydrofolate reductase C-terminal domain-containing protein [Proteobacteria bacterium]|nr:methylenetetrahydrofolate reductase C-terminal domain-containing protein [Pseudomonadota bacterium]MBU1686410.1 methylenetetrahydrofolate reductase C-terminal domain-containing protein [Pseudomonadota bacterium]
MIIAERKPVNEIVAMVRDAKRVLVLGCRGCVSVCSAGGEREVEILASLLRLGAQKEGRTLETIEATLVRQCDREYIEEIDKWDGSYDAIVSIACGVGVNFIANLRPMDKVYPGVNTSCFGGSTEQGVWTEQCAGCGNCILHLTSGLCPVARCAKSLMNGPCGGSVNGRCEIHKDVPCIWQSIHDRLNRIGSPGDFNRIAPIRDWSTAGHGGPRRISRDDLTI